MRECKILEFEITKRALGKKSAKTVEKEKDLVIKDYPEIEGKIASYLVDGWTISNFSIQKYTAPPNVIVTLSYDYIVVLLTR